jgi:uncharacterized protein
MNVDHEQLIKLANTKMPFGKYKDYFLVDVPEYYYAWLSKKGFPKGKFGEQLQLMHEIKINGLEELIRTIRKM